MTSGAIDALRAERAALLDIGNRLTPAQWEAPSGCPGWRVQDVVAHMGALYWLVVDRTVLPETSGVPTEQAQDLYVDARRPWSSGRVLDDYAIVSDKALDVLVDLEAQDFVLPLGDLGTYHASLLPNAFAFDHYTHIRADLFRPRGSLGGPPPMSDALRLGAALDWIVAAIPQQNGELLEGLPGAITVEVTGTAARAFTIGDGEEVARVRCSGHSLVLWSTQRASWEDTRVVASGDEATLAIARRVHVF
jgi:uncharacterized protein (TIGR03083 family)